VGVSLGLKVGFAVVGLNVGEGVVSVYSIIKCLCTRCVLKYNVR